MFKLNLIKLSLIGLIFIYFQTAMAAQLRISSEELKPIINQKSLMILDVRSKDDYDVGHIPGAISFPASFSYKHFRTDGKIQDPTRMQKLFRERGLDKNSNVVIYDENKLFNAARMFWTLEVYGLTKIKILDKGYTYWRNKNYRTSQVIPKVNPSRYVATIKHERLASKFATQLAIKNKNKVIIDARSLSAYEGKESVAKRFGHIPNAINVPFSRHITTEFGVTALKPIHELKKIYENIPKGKKVIIYCKIGLVSSTNYFALRELGHDVSNYDASWREWGNDDSLPIEK